MRGKIRDFLDALASDVVEIRMAARELADALFGEGRGPMSDPRA
jgi:hypothetical protein